MNLQLEPSMDLGLQHTLEGGLALLRGEDLEEGRRGEILSRLIEMFSEASSGSQAIQAHNLVFAVEQGPAFERFTMLFRHLESSIGTEWPPRLAEAVTVLNQMSHGGLPEEADREKVSEVLQRLLISLRRERALLPLVSPREI